MNSTDIKFNIVNKIFYEISCVCVCVIIPIQWIF